MSKILILNFLRKCLPILFIVSLASNAMIFSMLKVECAYVERAREEIDQLRQEKEALEANLTRLSEAVTIRDKDIERSERERRQLSKQLAKAKQDDPETLTWAEMPLPEKVNQLLREQR